MIGGQKVRHGDPVEQRTIPLQQLMHAAIIFRLQVDADVGAELARMNDHLISDRLPLGIVGFERCIDVFMMLQMLGERLSIATCLSHAEARMRARIHSGITDHGNTAKRDRRRREVLDRGDEWLPDLENRIAQSGRQQIARFLAHPCDEVFADQRRRDRKRVLHTIFIDAHVAKLIGARNAVPDDIVTPSARCEILVKASDWISKHLLALRNMEREVRIDGRGFPG